MHIKKKHLMLYSQCVESLSYYPESLFFYQNLWMLFHTAEEYNLYKSYAPITSNRGTTAVHSRLSYLNYLKERILQIPFHLFYPFKVKHVWNLQEEKRKSEYQWKKETLVENCCKTTCKTRQTLAMILRLLTNLSYSSLVGNCYTLACST